MNEKETSYRPTADRPYWLYDPEGDGMVYYRTREARDGAAARAVAAYLDEGWAEEVEMVSAGEVTHFAQCLDKTERPADLDEEDCDGEGTYWGDYAWMGTYTMAPSAGGLALAVHNGGKMETEELIEQVNELRMSLAMCWRLLPDGDYGPDAVDVKQCMTRFDCWPEAIERIADIQASRRRRLE